MAPAVRPAVNHSSFATDADKDLVERVMSCVLAWEQGVGSEFRDRCNARYKQYRGVQNFRDAWVKAGPNDRDGMLYEGKRTWGAHLHIPLSYRTIETMVPAAIAQRPKMLYMPLRERWADNVENVRILIDAQQHQVDIDLPFQAIMRSGRIYGLGVGKSLWRKEYARRRKAVEMTFAGKMMAGKFGRQYKLGEVQLECVFDDPDLEDVDIQDFMWDPFGSDMRTVEWVVHRSWPSTQQVIQRISSGAWATDSAVALGSSPNAVELIRMMGSGEKWDEVWGERNNASGFSSLTALGSSAETRHELLEWHNGDEVISVLDRQLAVQDAENQCVGTIPFHVYRPTPLQKQMVGIGDLEPLEHLQRELDTLRSQRRDAATIALCAGYAYDENSIEEDDLVFGPGAAIRVTNAARVSDAIMPLPVRDVPGSGYQEEQVIRQDFDAVAGINEALDPRGGASGGGTATESMLVQASLSRRIELGSRRFEIEVVRQAAKCWLHLNQRMVLKEREMALPAEGLTPEQAAHEGLWRKFKLGPAEIAGDFVIQPEGGSMAARNVPQDRQDAQMLMTMFGQHPNVNPRRPLERALKLMGVDDVQGWLKQDAPPVPPLALQLLEQAGVNPELIRYAVQSAQAQQPQLGGGPNVQQVDEAMQGAA